MPHESRRCLVKLEIADRFKGVKGPEIILTQYEQKKTSTSCPYFDLKLSETYLIYAFRFLSIGWDNQKINDIVHEVACVPTQKFRSDSPAYTTLVEYRSRREAKKVTTKKS